MSTGSFKIFVYKQTFCFKMLYIYIYIYIYILDLALNNQLNVICHKTPKLNQTSGFLLYIFIPKLILMECGQLKDISSQKMNKTDRYI